MDVYLKKQNTSLYERSFVRFSSISISRKEVHCSPLRNVAIFVYCSSRSDRTRLNSNLISSFELSVTYNKVSKGASSIRNHALPAVSSIFSEGGGRASELSSSLGMQDWEQASSNASNMLGGEASGLKQSSIVGYNR